MPLKDEIKKDLEKEKEWRKNVLITKISFSMNNPFKERDEGRPREGGGSYS